MKKMHQEIKKFWEDAGYILSNENQENTVAGVSCGTVTGTKLIDKDWSLSVIETIAFGDEHRYNGKWYSEEEMLRIIRMHAFL